MATLALLQAPLAHADDPHWTGASPCTLIEGVPGEGHPVRHAPAIASAVSALDRAGFDPLKNGKAHDLFVKMLDGLYAQAERAFALPPTRQGKPGTFAPGAAQRFLSANVLAANAPLRVGLERFEPSPEVAAMMMLAACRASRVDDVIAEARSVTLPESASLRAFGVLMLLARGDHDGARELATVGTGLPDEGFLVPYVQADLAVTKDERVALHALAGRRRHNGDQDVAWQAQAARLEVMP